MNTKEQAIDWFSRSREDELSAPELERFAQWLTESPVHVREYLEMARAWSVLQSPTVWPAESKEDCLEVVRQAQGTNVARLSIPADDGEIIVAARTWRRFVPVALAATVAAIAVTGWLVWNGNASTYTTARGEQRYVVLTDGSVVQLNTLTKLIVRFDGTRRRIELPRGEALFRVASDPHRPFEVQTPYARVRALGTEFNVYNRDEGTRVAVIAGNVQVVSAVEEGAARSGPASVVLAPRQSADVSTRGRVAVLEAKPTSPHTQPDTAWIQRRIVLDGERVAVAVAEFNRYNARQIRLEDPGLAQLRITGVFNADEPAALIEYLQEVRAVRVTETDGLLTIFPPDRNQ